MVKALWQAIKAEKKLSLKHWRYKLLHWTFWQRNIQQPSDSFLPKWLYTHYCPLFHLTNALVLLAPLTLLVHIGIFCAYLFVVLVAGLVGGIWHVIRDLSRKRATDEFEAKGPDHEAQWVINKLRFLDKYETYPTWERFWESYQNLIQILDQGQVFALYVKTSADLVKEKQARAAREAKMAARKASLEAWLLWLTNTSRILIKGTLTISGWVLFAAFVAFLATNAWGIAREAGIFVSWLASLPWATIGGWLLAILIGGCSIIASIGLGCSIIYLLSRVIPNKVKDVANTNVNFIFTPFGWPFRLIYFVARAIWNFVAVFYEESCPPIRLVEVEAVNSLANQAPQEEAE